MMFAPGWKLQSLVWRQGEATTGTLYLRVQGEEEHCSTAALQHCTAAPLTLQEVSINTAILGTVNMKIVL